jgi:hypothetical protein
MSKSGNWEARDITLHHVQKSKQPKRLSAAEILELENLDDVDALDEVELNLTTKEQ